MWIETGCFIVRLSAGQVRCMQTLRQISKRLLQLHPCEDTDSETQTHGGRTEELNSMVWESACLDHPRHTDDKAEMQCSWERPCSAASPARGFAVTETLITLNKMLWVNQLLFTCPSQRHQTSIMRRGRHRCRCSTEMTMITDKDTHANAQHFLF